MSNMFFLCIMKGLWWARRILQSIWHDGSKTLEIKHHLHKKWLMLSPYLPLMSLII